MEYGKGIHESTVHWYGWKSKSLLTKEWSINDWKWETKKWK